MRQQGNEATGGYQFASSGHWQINGQCLRPKIPVAQSLLLPWKFASYSPFTIDH
ncbi:hypothetical protein [Longitalea luteola]|uniref:hypothetical protein n=1 Tax=Longitalea luteola TaxID=2812563 RepID=UPI001A967C04|nr:hypothetical protein [Longitalea luteola]